MVIARPIVALQKCLHFLQKALQSVLIWETLFVVSLGFFTLGLKLSCIGHVERQGDLISGWFVKNWLIIEISCVEKSRKVAAQWTCVTFLIPHPRNTQRYGKFLFHSLLTIKFMHAKHSWKTFQAIFGNILKVLKFVSHMEKYEKMRVLTLKI